MIKCNIQIDYNSTIGGNREMDQLCTTLQVSKITRKTKFSPISSKVHSIPIFWKNKYFETA